MPRPTEEQWRSIRAAWESSPNGGLTWLTKRGGGPWDISAEALRRRRLHEGWRKYGAARGGTVGCWRTDADAHGPPSRAFALAEDPGRSDDDLRDALLRQHREDWGVVRGLIDAAVADGRVEAVRRVKIVVEVVSGLQDAERAVHGLDAALLDLNAMSLEQLEAVAAGRWPRRSR